ncbi:MAG: HDOD domain-containing protein [Gammaproteobacteria bacterium]|nr:HDOD domain-containing protein [Gammaproteobacteria bacterium]
MPPTDDPTPIANLQHKIESIIELPAMPEVAQALLRLNSDPNGNINDLVEIIELDPSIAAQIMRYARSSLFGFRGQIPSLHHAVTTVLGYGLTMDISLGLSLGKSFTIPRNGPLGLYAFWQHSVYSAVLVERLIKLMPRKNRPLPGLGFLGGLLHNFGVLLTAHLFPEEFARLQQIVKTNPEQPRTKLERQALGSDHTEIGAWLLRSWNLQAEVQVAVSEHHNEHYSGIHAPYARLTLIADRLLKRQNVGDVDSIELPEHILSCLGFSAEDAEEALLQVMDVSDDLDQLSQQFAA